MEIEQKLKKIHTKFLSKSISEFKDALNDRTFLMIDLLKNIDDTKKSKILINELKEKDKLIKFIMQNIKIQEIEKTDVLDLQEILLSEIDSRDLFLNKLFDSIKN